MKKLFRWPSRNRSEIQTEVDEEIRFHLDMRIAELTSAGMDGRDAREKALQEFGDLDQARRSLRRADLRNESRKRRSEWSLEMLHDLKYATRTLARSRTFGAVAILTLALGVAATTIVFSFADGVLLRPLPFRAPDQLFRLASSQSAPDFVDMRDALTDAAAMAAYHFDVGVLSLDSASESLPTVRVTPGFFEILGIAPVLGRVIGTQDAVPEQDRFVVLSDEIWRSRFAADPAIAGKTVRINSEPHIVLGVVPAKLGFPATARLWLPRSFSTRELTTQRGAHYLDVIGRLQPQSTLRQLQSRLSALATWLKQQYPNTNTRITFVAKDLKESIVGNYREPLVVLLAAGFCLLLIACANIAGLTLVRTIARGPELALRSALGAGKMRIVRALVAESIIIAAAGSAVGVALAWWGIHALVVLEAGQVPRLANVHLNLRGMLFALGIAIAGTGAFGLLPVLRIVGSKSLAPSLAEGGRSLVAAHSRGRLQAALVAGEVALTLVLLTGSGLLLRTFVNLRHTDLGFSAANVITLDVSLPTARYPRPEQARALFRDFEERLKRQPGVTSVGSISGIPLTDYSYHISVERLDGGPAYKDPGSEKSVQVRVASGDYFRTMGMRLVRGRFFDDTDREGAQLAAIVSETAARMLWPNEDALGHTLELGTRLGLGGAPAGGTVVGIVADYHEFGPRQPKPPVLFIAHPQFPVPDQTITIETAAGISGVLEAARSELRSIDPELAATNAKAFRDLTDDALAEDRSNAVLVTVFAASALVLAAIGIYGVTAYSVSQRTREFGVRMALGASGSRILAMVLRRSLWLAAIGVAVGLAGTLLLTRSLQKMLFALSPTDPATLVTVVAGFLLIAGLASWLPARAAGKVDPMSVLRES